MPKNPSHAAREGGFPSSEGSFDGAFDVAIIGAGVVGCAVARRLALDGARVVVLEKAREVLDGASKANSAILHTGFDAPPGSLEARCIAEGYREYVEIHARMNLPLIGCSALVLAWSEAEDERLESLMEQARANGVTDVTRLTAAEIRAREPGLSDGLRGGFLVPGESLIDPWSAPHAYLLQAMAHGAVCRRDTEVLGGTFDGDKWRLDTSGGAVTARCVINCAGLYGDVVDQRLLGRASFSIRPRKGQFVVYDKAAAALASAILLPVPTETTKGVVVCRTAFGNLLVGPTAEEQESRTDAGVVGETLAALKARGEEILPGLKDMPVTATYAGLRPATEEKAYRVHQDAERHYLTLGGIRSTGLSAALGLARHARDLIAGMGGLDADFHPPAEVVWPRMPNLTEGAPRGWSEEHNGGMVCHCEWVTRAEIDAALDGPLPPRSLAGLKRRTRVTMGRCQGFYCMGKLSEITAERFPPSDRLTEGEDA